MLEDFMLKCAHGIRLFHADTPYSIGHRAWGTLVQSQPGVPAVPATVMVAHRPLIGRSRASVPTS